MSLGNKIKELRNQKGMTQRELSEQLNVTAPAVSRWESDEVEPSVGTIKQIATIFNISIDELLGNETEPVVVEKEVVVEKPIIVEKPLVVEKEVVVEKTVAQKPVLAICDYCNKPIYDENELIKISVPHHYGRGNSNVTYTNSVYHKACKEKKDAEDKKRMEDYNASKNSKRLTISLIVSPIAALILFFIFLGVSQQAEQPWQLIVFGVVAGILAFTTISCFILQNNFLFTLWLSIASWSVKFPGIIFTFDLDGLKFLIVMKLLFAVLGVLISIAVFLLACAIAMPLSVLVYPYALYVNIKHRKEDKDFLN